MIGNFYGQSFSVEAGVVSFTVFPPTQYRPTSTSYPSPRLNIELPGFGEEHVFISLRDTYHLPSVLRELADVIDAEWTAYIDDCHAQAINEDAIRTQVQRIKECRAIA